MDALLGLALMAVGFFLLMVGIQGLRYIWARERCQRWINETGITQGPYIKHGMVIDKKTGLVRGTSTPSETGIRAFWK